VTAKRPAPEGIAALLAMPEISVCRSCHSLLRRSQDGLYYDIDLNESRNPEPWECSSRYVASPTGRHLPMVPAAPETGEQP
jgi:hypothetical protein